MTKPFKYSTIGGNITRGECYAQIMDRLREIQDLTAMMGHLHNTETSDMDKLMAKGWLGVSEMFKLVQNQVTTLAVRKMQ